MNYKKHKEISDLIKAGSFIPKLMHRAMDQIEPELFWGQIWQVRLFQTQNLEQPSYNPMHVLCKEIKGERDEEA